MSGESPQERYLLYESKERIAVPVAGQEARMAVRNADWDRLRRQVERIRPPNNALTIWYSLAFGFAGSATLGIIPLMLVSDMPAWVMPTYIISSVASTLLGCLLVWVGKTQVRQADSDLEELKAEMDEVKRLIENSSVSDGMIVATRETKAQFGSRGGGPHLLS